MSDHNPLLELQFAVPFDTIEAAHVEPAIDAILERSRAALFEIGRNDAERSYANTIEALDEATQRVEYAIGIVEHLESVATSDALRAAFNAVQPKVAGFHAQLPLDAELFAAVEAFAKTPEARSLQGPQARRLTKLRDEFRRHGADLGPQEKVRLAAIDVELAERTTRFAQNVLDATREWSLTLTDETALGGLPPSAVEAAAEAARASGETGWRFTLQAPSYQPLMTYLEDAGVREQVYRAFNTRATTAERDNGELIERILELRQSKARLLGFATFADLVLADRMAKNGEAASVFLEDLRGKTAAAFVRENESLADFRRTLEGEGAPALQPWDLAFYAERQRRALYDFDEEALRPYFAFDRVRDGMFEVARRLFGISVRPTAALPVWDPSVETYEVVDSDGTVLGAFYCDAFPRPTKRGGAWMNGLITAAGPARSRDMPHLGLICANVMPATGGKPALLTHRDVETLFHEFGHLLHHVLSTVEVRALGGTNVAWDFVELPSQIMENWAWEREALDLFAAHFEDGSKIPDPLFDAMIRARTFRAANTMMRQLGFASVDLELHTAYDPRTNGPPLEFARRHLERFTPAPLFAGYAMLASFSHLFAHAVGYAAGYYSYKWAEVLDADAFGRFKDAGVFDRATGRAFRDQILARGDAADPGELFVTFMGRPPSADALLARSGLLDSVPWPV